VVFVAPKIARALHAVFVVLYPAIVYIALTRLGARAAGLLVAAALVVGLALRARGERREHAVSALGVPLTLIGVALLGAVFDDERLVLALPVIANLALLAHFAASLRGMPIVERFARAIDDDVWPEQVVYCRKVTVLWCGFFAVNAVAIAALAVFAPLAWWTLYAGVGSYVLVGAMVSAEYVVRRYLFRKYGTNPFDRVLSRLMPARHAP
jgi:uncharacterized membrane protein